MSPLSSNTKVTLIRVGSKHSGAGKDKRAVRQMKAWCGPLPGSWHQPQFSVLHGHLCISVLYGVSLYSNPEYPCLSPFSFASSKRYSCSIPELPVRSLDVNATLPLPCTASLVMGIFLQVQFLRGTFRTSSGLPSLMFSEET